MSLMRRVRDITLATLNERLEKAEDPVRLIDQFLWSTREDIIQVEKLYQQYTGHAARLKQTWLQAEQQRDKREQQALLALKANEEHAARLALQEKTLQAERAAQYKALYEESRAQIEELEQQMRELRLEYQTVYDKREFFSARMESLRLQQRMNARYSGTQAEHAQPNTMFRRLDDRLNDMELEARSLRDVRRSLQHNLQHNGQAMQSQIEVELEQLRRKLEEGG